MATITMEVDAASSNHGRAGVERWVKEMAQMCQPDRVYWCDGSSEEHGQCCDS